MVSYKELVKQNILIWSLYLILCLDIENEIGMILNIIRSHGVSLIP